MSVQTSVVPVNAGQSNAKSYNLRISVLSGDTMQVSWEGVPGRNPNDAGDFIALWQSDSEVPWGTKPLNVQSITNTTPDGSTNFTGLSLSRLAYVIGYSVGSEQKQFNNLACALPIGVGGSSGALQTTAIGLSSLGSTSAAFSYTTPDGMMPQNAGHQVVIVSGRTFRLDGGNTVATQKISSNRDTDVVAFNFDASNPLVAGNWYTAAYVAGAALKNVAAVVTFQVS